MGQKQEQKGKKSINQDKLSYKTTFILTQFAKLFGQIIFYVNS